MPLPNPGMSFTPFDPLPASDLNDMVENIEALQDGSAFDAQGIPGGKVLLNPPQGFMINGKIARTVSSNNITIAIKTLAGNDPSSGDPVYVRIGDTMRAITAALSVTKNAGTNWMNLGAAETAAQDTDVFVYLGYNTTDGVVIGFSRIPSARVYSDFSATSTNEKYAAISTITSVTSTDVYELIGRVNVTLGVSASYNWSVPATSIIISRPIFETRWLTCVTTLINAALGNGTVTYSQYKVFQDRVRVRYKAVGGSTSSLGAGTNGNILPLGADNPGNLVPIGSFIFFDASSGSFYPGWVGLESVANNTRWLVMTTSAALGLYASIASATPADWDASDVIAFDVDYKYA